jgi:hypothetical protein
MFFSFFLTRPFSQEKIAARLNGLMNRLIRNPRTERLVDPIKPSAHPPQPLLFIALLSALGLKRHEGRPYQNSGTLIYTPPSPA